MDLVTPDIGLAIWTTLAFSLLLILLRKFAWGPILKGINDREQTISDSLKSAEKAREEMAELHTQNQDLLREARIERDLLLKAAREAKETMINESKAQAQVEADKIMATARENINHEKMAAISELKNQVATLSIEIAEKVIRKKLSDDQQQKALIESLIEDVKLN